MSFLAPLFLLGALAVIGPVIFHLIRRTTREKTLFSTLMFLQPTPPRITRRSRLENLWLLLLRCLVIGLLAFAFARPFFRQQPNRAQTTKGSQRTVVLIDTSASMQREDAWTAALKTVNDRLTHTEPTDEVAVLAFDRSVQPLMSFADWTALRPDERAPIANQRLSTLHPTWAATHLDTALLRASELLDARTETEPAQHRIIVVSDLQEGARLDGLQGYEWPRGTTVEFVPVTSRHAANASIQWVPESDEAQPPGDPAPLRLRVTNSAGDKREQFPIRWVGASATDAAAKIDAYVPAGQTRIVRPPRTSGLTSTSLALDGDDVAFDNTVFVLPSQPVRVPIVFLGKDAPTDPNGSLYYLNRAFPKTRTENVEIIAQTGDQAVPDFQIQESQLVVLGDSPGSAAVASARRAAEAGRVVLLPLASATSAGVVADLLQRPDFNVSEAPAKDYALLGDMDFQHPLFASFADPRFSDFTKIHFWKHRRIDVASFANSRVIARFDHGDPAIVQVPLGRGSVVIFTSSWQPADSQLALSSKFVPLLHALLDESTSLPITKAQYFIGDSIPMPAGTQPLSVRKPDGTEVSLAAGAAFAAADQPGIYAVTPGNRRFVVNVPPEESHLSPLPLDRFAALGIPLQSREIDPHTAARRATEAQAIELETRQKVWRWLIAGAVGVLLLETLIAGKLSAASRSSTVPS